ncbi:chaperonin 10-like protein [Aspergillus californicus]
MAPTMGIVTQSPGLMPLPGGWIREMDLSTMVLDNGAHIDDEPVLKPQVIPTAGVPSTQRAILTREVGRSLEMALETVPVREPGAGEVVLRILYSGICRSDATFSTGPLPGYPKHNHIAGHEGIGQIVKSRESDHIALSSRLYGVRYLAWSCGSCTYCVHDLPTSCPFQLNTPKQIPGTFQEYITVPSCVLVPLPETISESSTDLALYAAALCSGSTALKSLRVASLRPGDVIVVVGVMGAIGHLVGMIAKQVLGAKVIGVDLAAKVRRVVPAEQQDYIDILLAAPECDEGVVWEGFHATLAKACAQLRRDQGEGVSRAAEAVIVTSSSREGFQKLDEYVCDGGTIICVGVPKGLTMVSLPLHCLVERNLHLTGNLMGGHHETLEVMEYIRTGQITPRITTVGLTEVPEQMQSMIDCQTVGKVVIRMSK